MALKFNDEMIINGTEWTYPTFKFDVDSITPTGGETPIISPFTIVLTDATSVITGSINSFLGGGKMELLETNPKTGKESGGAFYIYYDRDEVSSIHFTWDNSITNSQWNVGYYNKSNVWKSLVNSTSFKTTYCDITLPTKNNNPNGRIFIDNSRTGSTVYQGFSYT